MESEHSNNSAEKQLNFTKENLKTIGIDFEYSTLGDGFIKYYPTDFIVEEIPLEGEIITVDSKEVKHEDERANSGSKIAADLIKEGISTIEASQTLSTALDIPLENIAYAGIKDARAVTSQEILIKDIKKEQVEAVKAPAIHLKNIRERKGIIKRGDLKGNRFTILVRSQDVSEDKLQKIVTQIKQHGFYNFYSLQRFGNRLISHHIGENILKQDYEGAVRMNLFLVTPYDSAEINEARKQAEVFFNQEKYREAYELFKPFPEHLFFEMQLLKAYEEQRNFVRALKAVPDQTRLYVQAYNSFWFNKLLSKKILEGNVPETLPLLSNFEGSREAYKEIIPEAEMAELVLFQEPFERIISFNNRFQIPTVLKPKIDTVGKCKAGYIFVFELGKGAYATTFLTNFFELKQFGKKPSWIVTEKVDTLKMLGRESILAIEAKLQ